MLLKLGGAPNGWLELLPGVRARFDPITRPMVRAARRAAAAVMADHPEMDEAELRETAGDAFTAELIRRGLVEWEGIGDAEGNPLACDAPGAMDAFLAEPLLFEAADLRWVVPWAVQAAEKNASSPLPAGTSKAATGAKTIAGSAAKRPKKAGRKGTAAKSAHTGSMRRKPTTAKPSGK